MAEKGRKRKPRLSPEQKEQKRLEKLAKRKKIFINLEQAEKLGMIMATLKECSAFMEINVSTLEMRTDFMEAWHRGKEKGKMSLRRKQFQMAEKSAAMSIWLGKQYLGQKDKQEIDQKVNINPAEEFFSKAAKEDEA